MGGALGPVLAGLIPLFPAGAPSRKAEKAGRIGVSLTVLAFLLLLGGVVARGLSAGRLPWGNMYEFSLTAALAVTGTFLVLLWRRDVRYLGLFVVMPVLLINLLNYIDRQILAAVEKPIGDEYGVSAASTGCSVGRHRTVGNSE